MLNKPIVIGVIGLILGFFIGSMFPISGSNLSSAQIAKLKKVFPIIPEMRVLTGTIQKIDGNNITLEVTASANPFDEWSTTRSVVVNDKTKIIKTSAKDSKTFQAEMDAFSKASMQDRSKQLPYPSYLKEEIIQLSDLKVGNVISVEADHNIKTETKFTPIKIATATGGMGIVPPPTPVQSSSSSSSGSTGSGKTLPPPPTPVPSSDTKTLPPPPTLP